MAGEWVVTDFTDAVDFQEGPGILAKDFHDDGVPLIRLSGLDRGASLLTGCNYLDPRLVAKKWGHFALQKGDILLSTSASLGRIAVVDNEGVGAIAYTGIIRMRPRDDRVVAPFLRYLFEGPDFQQQAEAFGAGSVIRHFGPTHLRQMTVLLPPPNEQRVIAHILGTLDDKIELNRKQNETLEAMARALFKAWFVNFEPVRAKLEGRWQRGQSLPGLPAHLYDLFPDQLVESELGEIPEGWPIVAFEDVAHQGKRTVNPGVSPQDSFTHYSLPAFDAAQMPVIELGETIKSNKTPVPDGAVLVSKLNPRIPRVWLVGDAGGNAVCSTEFIVWTPKAPANSAFLYCLASSSEFNSVMRQLVTGTSNSHQRVKPEQLRGIRVIAASPKAVEFFSEAVRCSIGQVLQNRQQSRSLTQLRDTLLPKLISGELRVPDAETFLKERGP